MSRGGIRIETQRIERSPEQAKSACEGKVRYKFASHAVKEGKRLRREKGAELGPLTVYPCEYCNGWHLGKATRTILARLRVVQPA